jgi:uncharacterized membrane protein (UPF0127 family)
MDGYEPTLVVNLTRGNVVCERGLIADRAPHRIRGLIGREQLSPQEGLLLMPAPAIQTAFMRFPIDAVLLDANLRIVKLAQRLEPWRATAARRARSALVLAAGGSARRGLQQGDRLAVLEQPFVPWRTRVLLASSDRRFRAVASALLTQRGCAVSVHDRADEVTERASRERIEVVVLDATDSLTATAHTAARLHTLRPRVGVVAVSGDPGEQLTTLPVFSKWGSFDTLLQAIEQAKERPGDGLR